MPYRNDFVITNLAGLPRSLNPLISLRFLGSLSCFSGWRGSVSLPLMRGVGRRVQQAGCACQAARRCHRIFASGANDDFTQRDFDSERINALSHEILKHGTEARDAIICFTGLFVAVLIIIVGHGSHLSTSRRERSTIFGPYLAWTSLRVYKTPNTTLNRLG
jgi:hypothetical protein